MLLENVEMKKEMKEIKKQMKEMKKQMMKGKSNKTNSKNLNTSGKRSLQTNSEEDCIDEAQIFVDPKSGRKYSMDEKTGVTTWLQEKENPLYR